MNYLNFVSGLQAVYMSITVGGYSTETSQLTAGALTLQLHGILCENG